MHFDNILFYVYWPAKTVAYIRIVSGMRTGSGNLDENVKCEKRENWAGNRNAGRVHATTRRSPSSGESKNSR